MHTPKIQATNSITFENDMALNRNHLSVILFSYTDTE